MFGFTQESPNVTSPSATPISHKLLAGEHLQQDVFIWVYFSVCA